MLVGCQKLPVSFNGPFISTAHYITLASSQLRSSPVCSRLRTPPGVPPVGVQMRVWHVVINLLLVLLKGDRSYLPICIQLSDNLHLKRAHAFPISLFFTQS